MRVPPRGVLALGAAILLVVSASPAQDDVNDHLKCYRVKDPLDLHGIVDITTKLFPPELGCRVKMPRIRLSNTDRDFNGLLCVPAGTTVRESFDAGQPMDLLSIRGEELEDSRLCYQIQCDEPFPPGLEITDQFGNRVLEALTPFMVCVPAVQGPPCLYVSTTGSPASSGTRDDPIETIGGGITKAAAESIRTVCIDGGTYEESVTLASRVDMLGGFNSAAPRSAGS